MYSKGHGGNIYNEAVKYDFSVNTNPLGMPEDVKEKLKENLGNICQVYPEETCYELRKSISLKENISEHQIMCGNGASELIYGLVRAIRPRKALVVVPSFSEYIRALRANDSEIVYYQLAPERDFIVAEDIMSYLTPELDMVFLCNPNNPTSSCISLDDMRTILDVCKEHGIYVMVDETYIEFVEDVAHTSAVSLTAYYNNIIILRGTSKFFAAPGLRLGYAITGNEDLLRNMNQRKNPWMINSLAAIAGELMFQDDEYIQATRDLISTERARCYQTMLNSKRFHPYKPTANFMLMRIMDEDLNSGILFDRAIREGLMIRDCSTFPFLNDKYIRFCFMDPADNDRLLDCLLR